jgi:hypothetical protein
LKRKRKVRNEKILYQKKIIHQLEKKKCGKIS